MDKEEEKETPVQAEGEIGENEKDGQPGLRTIRDETARRWYDTGFKFALNYLLAWLPEPTSDDYDEHEFNTENFKKLVSDVIGDEDWQHMPVIDPDYFAKLYFYKDNNKYGGLCPDPYDTTVCIPCTAAGVRPVPRPKE